MDQKQVKYPEESKTNYIKNQMTDLQLLEFEFAEKRIPATMLVFIPLLIFFTGIDILLISNLYTVNGDFKLLAATFIWTFFLVTVYRSFLWNLFGNTKVELKTDGLTIEKKGTFLTRPQKYDLNKVRNLKLVDYKFSFLNFLVSRGSLINLQTYGCITFNYENKEINFGGNISGDKAQEIVEIIQKRKGLL